MSAIGKAGILFRNGIQKLRTWLGEVSGWIAIVMMLTISYDVAMRYIFGAPTKWSLELNEYLLLFLVYLSGAWTLSVGGHVRVDIVYSRLSPRTQAKLEIFTCLLGLIFCAILTWQGILFVHDGLVTGARSETYMAIIQWPIRLLMVIGAALLSLEFIFRLSHYAGVLISGGEEG